MRTWIAGALIATLAGFTPVEADVKDEAAIKTIIESVGILADQGYFSALEKLYADEVEVDYTSLNGGEVERKSPQALMTQWAAVLPGFDLTRHDISNIAVKINGPRAEATADVIADHYVGDLFWQVKGDYRYALQQEDGIWRITSHTFHLRAESGTREVFGLASENAIADPVPYIKRQKTEVHVKAIQEFFVAYAENNTQEMGEFLAEDIVWRVPGRHPLSGEKRGKAEVVAFFQQLVNANFKADPIYFGAEGDYVVDVHRGWSNVDGADNVDTIWALLYRFEDGKIAEATNLSGDQDAANAFFWSAYKLKPIPHRLAE